MQIVRLCGYKEQHKNKSIIIWKNKWCLYPAKFRTLCVYLCVWALLQLNMYALLCIHPWFCNGFFLLLFSHSSHISNPRTIFILCASSTHATHIHAAVNPLFDFIIYINSNGNQSNKYEATIHIKYVYNYTFRSNCTHLGLKIILGKEGSRAHMHLFSCEVML